MAGRIILGIANPALDDNGLVDSGATLTFYQNGLTTPQAVYTDATLGVALSNPLSCDAAGRFPQIWAPDDSLYSVKWTPTGASPITYDDIAPAANTGSGLEISDAFYSTLALADAAAAAAGAILVI